MLLLMLLLLDYVLSAFAYVGFALSGYAVFFDLLKVILLPFIVFYSFGLFLAKIFALFSKKKPQEGIYIRAYYILILCIFVCSALSFTNIIDDDNFFAIIFTFSAPFLIISLIVLLLLKKIAKKDYKRDNAFEDLLEKSRKNEE
jgi:hypothetical protein